MKEKIESLKLNLLKSKSCKIQDEDLFIREKEFLPKIGSLPHDTIDWIPQAWNKLSLYLYKIVSYNLLCGFETRGRLKKLFFRIKIYLFWGRETLIFLTLKQFLFINNLYS